jgi:hypothetical protein
VTAASSGVMTMSDRSDAWHQSTLSSLLDGCSWQYFLEYVVKVESPQKAESLAGSAYHAAVEAHESGRVATAPVGKDAMLEVATEYVRERGGDDEVASEARAAVENFFAPMKDGNPSHQEWLQAYEPVAIEKYFKLPLVAGAKPIGGTVDGVYRDADGGLLLIDHKTANNLSRWGAEGEEHRSQATLYSTAVALSPEYAATALVPMHYLVVRRSLGRSRQFEAARRVTVQPGLEDVALLGDRVREAERVVAEEDFVRNPAWNLCDKRWCAFYEQCVVSGELAGTVEQVRAKLGA